MTDVFIKKKGKLGHRHIQRADDVKTWRTLSTRQGMHETTRS